METRGIAEGMTVRAADGKKLGKVIECAEGSFVVEKGLFFPKDYSIRYDQVAELRDGEVFLRVSDFDERDPAGEQSMGAPPTSTGVGGVAGAGIGAAGTPAGAGIGAGLGAIGDMVHGESKSQVQAEGDELRVPLAEEQLEAAKVDRQTGEVRVHKDVVTEHKQVSVPVTREEVQVDRVPAQGDAAPGEAAFRDETLSVPVHEEEVEIRKRPVVKEEVRVSRSRRQEERRADADVRREEARIEGDEDRAARGDAEAQREIEGTREFEPGSDYPRSDIDEPKRH